MENIFRMVDDMMIRNEVKHIVNDYKEEDIKESDLKDSIFEDVIKDIKLDMKFALETVLDICKEKEWEIPYKILLAYREELEELDAEVTVDVLATLDKMGYDYIGMKLLRFFDLGRF